MQEGRAEGENMRKHRLGFTRGILTNNNNYFIFTHATWGWDKGQFYSPAAT